MYLSMYFVFFQQNVKRQLITSSQESSSVSHSKPGRNGFLFSDETMPTYYNAFVWKYYCDYLTFEFCFSVSGHHIHIPNNLLSQMQPEVLEILELEPSWDFNIINLEKATAKRWAGNRGIICFSSDLI